jgi:hypothetical protein
MASKVESEKQFQEWVDSVRWQFAKTYAKNAPHEYTITEWRPELHETLRAFACFIREHGQIDLYHGHPFTVYYLNGWKYWSCDKDSDNATLINRTCEEWSVKFGLTWNPPKGFNAVKNASPRIALPDHVFGYTPEGHPKQILTPEEDAKYPPMSLDEMRAFIAANQWTFAKTMPECPHYYVVVERALSSFDCLRFVAQIRRTGYAHKFYSATMKYLDVDEWYYWSMGWPIDETEVLNRAEKRLQENYVEES